MTEHGLGVSPSFLDARGGLYGRTMQAKWALRSASADTTCVRWPGERDGDRREREEMGSQCRKWASLCLPDIHLLQ